MSDIPVSCEELIHAEIEALKVSVVMLKLNEQGQVVNRILVHNNDINQFKQLGYAEIIKENYDPQIGHTVQFRHLDLRKEIKDLIHQSIIKEFSLLRKIQFFLKRLFRMV